MSIKISITAVLYFFIVNCQCSANTHSGLPDLSALRALTPSKNMEVGSLPKRMIEFHERVMSQLEAKEFTVPQVPAKSTTYMMDLYREKMEESAAGEMIISGRSIITRRNRRKSDGANKMNGKERTALKRSDTVRSFTAIDSFRSGESWVLTFDLSTLLANERIRLSEMQVSVPDSFRGVKKIVLLAGSKKNQGEPIQMGSIAVNTKRIPENRKITIEATNVLRRWYRKDNTGKSSSDAKEFEREVESTEETTLVVFSNNKNYGLIDAASERQERVRRESSVAPYSASEPKTNDRQRRRKQKNRRRNKTEYFTSEIESKYEEEGFNSNSMGNELEQSEVTSHQSSHIEEENEKKVDEVDAWKEEQQSRRKNPTPEAKTFTPLNGFSKQQEPIHCRKVAFEVDFDQVGWGDWIIYPKRYQAYRCEGLCNVPMMQNHIPTNHAFVQSVLSASRPDLDIPLPCCVPTKLKPLSLLYFENGEVVQRDHEDMVVEECGCR